MLVRNVMEKVTVIGAGMSGAVTAALIRKHLPDSLSISVLDKGRGAGGRMSTSRGPVDCDCSVDLGAQYISATPQYYSQHQEYYSELEKLGLLRPLTGLIEGDDRHSADSKHFSTPAGVSSLVKHFLKKSGATVEYNKQIVNCDLEDGRWVIKSADGTTFTSDGLILTMPVPQILNLNGTIKSVIESRTDILEKLKSVSYSSRFALGLFYKPGTKIDVPWCAKYVNGDPVIRFVAIDSKKRDITEGGTSVAVHASVPFSLKHLEEDKDSICTKYLLPRVRELVPELPEPDAVKNHKWRYSQVHQGYEGSPGAVLIQENPALLLAGDCFVSASRFDGCIDSAVETLKLVSSISKL